MRGGDGRAAGGGESIRGQPGAAHEQQRRVSVLSRAFHKHFTKER
jgi:hypothetical protein